MTSKRTPKANGGASDAARAEWLRRVEAEYRSAAITQHLGLWLIQIGAPPELIADAGRIVGDEMMHSELSHETFVAAGGSGTPNLPRESLGLPRSRAPLEHDVLRVGVEVFCLGETVAVRLFKRLRAKCTAPEARRALDRILRDEVRHRDFGWTLLEWMLATPAEKEYRALLEKELPGMLARVRRNYGLAVGEAPRDAPDVPEADRA
ncbi:MAG TPA: ferritin-like domain-containing protein, partial [Polyangiaceae bacterium]|nr:ferritin-like domain-containing protein [Polyangiaceae bacterium]